MTRKSVLGVICGLVLSASVLSGCASSTPSSAKIPSTSGTLIIGDKYGDPGNWDPIATFLLSWGEVASNIFEGLVFRGPHLHLHPALATSWHYVGTNKLVFNLRKGVIFQDGEPFNATAVQFTFNRLLGPLGQKGPQYANYTAIKSVKILGPYQVEFVLSRPDPTLITKLAGYGAMIVPPKYIEKHGSHYFGLHPIGTGPFRVVKYVPGSEVVLQRFNRYWRGPAKLKTVIYKFITDDSTRLADLQTGSINVMQDVLPSQASTVKGNSNLKLLPTVSPTVEEFGTDESVYPTNNVLVRRAINMAINIPAIIKNVLLGYGTPISTFQGPLSFGNDPNLKPYPYNPTEAKKLLKQAGVKPGTPLSIGYVGTDTTFQQVAQASAQYLDKVGFKVTLHPYDSTTFFDKLIPAGHGQAGNLWEFGWGGWTLDFDNTAELLYAPHQFWNPTFDNAQVNQLLKAERSTLNQSKRLQDFYKLDKVLHNLAVGVPLWDVTNLWAISSNVHGFVAPPDDRLWLWPVSVSK